MIELEWNSSEKTDKEMGKETEAWVYIEVWGETLRTGKK